MNTETIKEINEKCPYDQGIHKQPWGIPDNIQEYVIYSRYVVGGHRGGSCWGDVARPFSEKEPDDSLKVLDITLETLAPSLTFLHYRRVLELVNCSEDSQWEYYGNSTDWEIKYVILSELEVLLKELGYKISS